jgi:hypothetical protein
MSKALFVGTMLIRQVPASPSESVHGAPQCVHELSNERWFAVWSLSTSSKVEKASRLRLEESERGLLLLLLASAIMVAL